MLDNRVAFQFAPVPFEVGRRQQRWWTDEDSLKTVVNEYLKIAFYYANY